MPIYSGTPTRVVLRSCLPHLSPAPPPPDARRPRPRLRCRRQLPLTPYDHNSAPAFRTPAPRIPYLVLFSACTLQVLPVLLHSCTPLLTLLLRCADTHALACPLDLAPLAPYALHSVYLLSSPTVSIMIMISIPHPVLLAPRASRSLGLLRLQLFRSCFHFRLGHPFRTLIPLVAHIPSESISDPYHRHSFPSSLSLGSMLLHTPCNVLTHRTMSHRYLARPPLLLCASSTDLSLRA
jgi:hypothetical protein